MGRTHCPLSNNNSRPPTALSSLTGPQTLTPPTNHKRAKVQRQERTGNPFTKRGNRVTGIYAPNDQAGWCWDLPGGGGGRGGGGGEETDGAEGAGRGTEGFCFVF